MAEAVPSQRSFSKHLKSLTAAQMRETVSGAVRTISEDEQASNQTKVELAEPLDYEKELFNSKDCIKQVKDEKIISLLLFPTNDITVSPDSISNVFSDLHKCIFFFLNRIQLKHYFPVIRIGPQNYN